ncbi:Protein GLUTAMINE DUMPER 5 [Raphanus sativus]|uniref:Protein GLUTAMINE DUMPER 5 n=1 Tax=Raphanus sativus TaxID=3726 RepID=A0A6J0N8R9_RAPSA|nr:protein GLUTAMINE DUMPER 5 [Raphanus sativus]KAJ4900529.1 Protein GLUTAMINE DUMPER 5 [Raphanus sativus]
MRSFPNIPNHKMSTIMESQTRHPWRSPVPYLFGGLAAMLGLIAFALLLLACSYWSFSRRTNSEGDGEKQTESGEKVTAKVFEEKILVIMAGQNKPTFLATPVLAKTCMSSAECVITEDKEGQNGESTEIKGSLFSPDEENQ